MAKKKRDKGKDRSLANPKLSRGDKVVYRLAQIVGGFVLAGLGIGLHALWVKLTASPSVIVMESHLPNSYIALLAVIPCMVWVILLEIPYRSLRPVFPPKKPVRPLGGEPIYGQPLFGKDRPRLPAGLRKKLLLTCLAGMLLPLLLLLWNPFGRYELEKDMTVVDRNAFGTATARYEADEVETVLLEIAYIKTHRHSSTVQTQVTFTMKNGVSYRFDADPATLLEVKSSFPQTRIAYELYMSVEKYIEQKRLSEEDAAILREVFPDP